MSLPQAVFKSLTPMIPTGGSLAEAVAFYTDKLGFTLAWQDGEMAEVTRGSVAFHLVANNNREWALNSSYSIGVSNLEALHHEYGGPGIQVGPLETKPWGRLEFHLIVPSGVCFQFYEQA